MTAATIARLAWYLPKNTAPAGSYVLDDNLGIDKERAQLIMHYAYQHKNLQFGWDFAKYFAEHIKAPFPAFLHGYDQFIWRAYKFLQGYEDPVIAGAVALCAPGYTTLRGNIQDLLVNDQVENYQYIADKLGIPLTTVVAYEKLFFNIFDRRKEHAFIAELVYPEGRMVEVMKDYLEKTGIATLMLRAGYKHNPDVALYLMGIGEHPYKNFDASVGAMELDKMFMQDGILYAAAGLQNVDNAVPLKNARLSIQAGKMGNNEQKDNGLAVPLAESMRNEIIRISELKARAIARAKMAEREAATPHDT